MIVLPKLDGVWGADRFCISCSKPEIDPGCLELVGRVVGPSGREEEKEGCGVLGNPVDPREGGGGWDSGLLEVPGELPGCCLYVDEPFGCCELLFCGGEEALRPSGPD